MPFLVAVADGQTLSIYEAVEGIEMFLDELNEIAADVEGYSDWCNAHDPIESTGLGGGSEVREQVENEAIPVIVRDVCSNRWVL